MWPVGRRRLLDHGVRTGSAVAQELVFEDRVDVEEALGQRNCPKGKDVSVTVSGVFLCGMAPQGRLPFGAGNLPLHPIASLQRMAHDRLLSPSLEDMQ